MTKTEMYIQPKEILKELSSLSEKLKGTNLVRATLFNLVIYSKKDSREAYFRKIAETTIKKFPCRVIFITEEDRSEESFLKTYVTELRPEEESSIFCDMIHFEVCGKHRERIPFVVLPHLLSDRPVYLLRGDDPITQDPLLLKLEEIATRTIFDSEGTKNFTAFAKILLTLQESVHIDTGDLNWARTTSFRTLFSEIFNSKEKLASLLQVKEIEITYNKINHEIPALYFQAWLASRLSWEFQHRVGETFSYLSRKSPITVRLAASLQENLPPGRLLSVLCKVSEEEKIYFTVNPKEMDSISVQYTSKTSCELPFLYKLPKEHLNPSLVHEIYNVGTSATFLEALKLLAKTL
ncbi:MAG: glucose-6-phosphate dehydrogenase assembly protein OpcA [Verrucomicrobia bacterium]|nr:glucose-6-phosphate dehydrogenase assembly protein OpcA [Verrucomicrobiota bacterium]